MEDWRNRAVGEGLLCMLLISPSEITGNPLIIRSMAGRLWGGGQILLKIIICWHFTENYFLIDLVTVTIFPIIVNLIIYYCITTLGICIPSFKRTRRTAFRAALCLSLCEERILKANQEFLTQELPSLSTWDIITLT